MISLSSVLTILGAPRTVSVDWALAAVSVVADVLPLVTLSVCVCPLPRDSGHCGHVTAISVAWC